MVKQLLELIAGSRQLAREARTNAMRSFHDDHKRLWEKIAAMHDDIADGYERILVNGAKQDTPSSNPVCPGAN